MDPDEPLRPYTGAVDPGFLWRPRQPTDQPDSDGSSEGSRHTAQEPYPCFTMRGTVLSSLSVSVQGPVIR